MSKGSLFLTAFGDAVPRDVVLIGDAAPAVEYQRRAELGGWL